MKFSWDLIQTFEKVATTGSLLAASKELGMSQPTVGRQIDALEKNLGVSLFIRSREGMKLTEAGANLVATSSDMARTADDFQRLSLGMDKKVTGSVRLSANEVFGVHILPRIITDFIDENPGIEVELDIDNEPANLLRRDADVALRMFRPTQGDLIARKITEIKLGFFAHRDYLEKFGRPKHLDDLTEHRLIGQDRGMGHIRRIKALGPALSASDYTFRSDNFLTHIETLKTGLGIGVVQTHFGARLTGVEQVLADFDLSPIELWIVCHSEVQHNQRVRLLMDFLGRRLKLAYSAKP